ncbi:hypothetical protein DSECCO2_99670 [anaerobic digester metagenome]|jgi:hypothetical protein
MTGADEFLMVSLYTAEWLFDQLKEGDFTFNTVFLAVSSRTGYQPRNDQIRNTIASCGFYKVTRKKLGTTELEYTEKLTNEFLSALYGHLATKEQDDPGPLRYTLYDYSKCMRGCYAYDYLLIRPYILRYLYYERYPDDIILYSDLISLRQKMNITDWISDIRYNHCCSRVLNECGYYKRSNRGRCIDPVNVSRGKILRNLERCHRELSGDLPSKDEIKEYCRIKQFKTDKEKASLKI